MKVIPIHDATAPVVCTATGAELEARIQQIEHLRRDLAGIERTEHGLLLHFPVRPDIDAHLRSFTVDEQACCPFWGFEITVDDGALCLRWDGPPDVTGAFEELLRWFEGDEPLTAGSLRL